MIYLNLDLYAAQALKPSRLWAPGVWLAWAGQAGVYGRRAQAGVRGRANITGGGAIPMHVPLKMHQSQ
jgi:hypothetical protein